MLLHRGSQVYMERRQFLSKHLSLIKCSLCSNRSAVERMSTSIVVRIVFEGTPSNSVAGPQARQIGVSF